MFPTSTSCTGMETTPSTSSYRSRYSNCMKTANCSHCKLIKYYSNNVKLTTSCVKTCVLETDKQKMNLSFTFFKQSSHCTSSRLENTVSTSTTYTLRTETHTSTSCYRGYTSTSTSNDGCRTDDGIGTSTDIGTSSTSPSNI